MKRIRLTALLLVAVFVASTLTGCGLVGLLIPNEAESEIGEETEADNIPESESSSETEAEIETELETESEAQAEPSFLLTKEELAKYTIIIPEGCSEEISERATQLRDSVKSFIKVELPIRIDLVTEGSNMFFESEYEILVGLVDRAESIELHADLKSNDLGYALVNKKIVIAGHTDSAVRDSVYLFVLDILKGSASDSDVIMASGDQKIIPGTYKYSDILLNGVSISEYTIVYARSGSSNQNIIASELARRIAEVSGIVMEVVNDKSSEPAEHEIHIGDTNRITDGLISEREGKGYSDTDSYIAKCENGVWISGRSYVMLTLALDRFMSAVKSNGDAGSIDIGEGDVYRHDTLNVSFMSYNVRYDLETTERDPQGVMTTIAAESPDVFGALEVTDQWADMLTSYFGDEYTYVSGKKNHSSDNGEYTPIFFKTEKFELIDQGTKWFSKTPNIPSMYTGADHYKIFTYVVLKDKVTGVRFMYINAHFEPYQEDTARKARVLQAEQLKEFIEGQSIPVICGGDFNAIPNEDPISILTTGGNLRYALNLAKEKVQTGGTLVSSDYTTLGGRVYDYIFVSQSRVTVQKYKMMDNKDENGKYPSDHIPVRADVVIYQ